MVGTSRRGTPSLVPVAGLPVATPARSSPFISEYFSSVVSSASRSAARRSGLRRGVAPRMVAAAPGSPRRRRAQQRARDRRPQRDPPASHRRQSTAAPLGPGALLEQLDERGVRAARWCAPARSRRCGSPRRRRRRSRRRPPSPRRRWPPRSAPDAAGRGRRPCRSRSRRAAPSTSSASARASDSMVAARPRWRAEQVGCTATDATRRRTSSVGQQVIVRPGDRVDHLDIRPRRFRGRTSWRPSTSGSVAAVRPPLHGLGRAPTSCARPRACSPSTLHGVPQQLPGASGGIHTGLPARAETCTSASDQPAPRGVVRETPNIRLMQAGR